MSTRHLLLVLGDQLNHDSLLFADADPQQDVVCMAELHQESTHVWSHKARTTLFLSAMRHFAAELRERGWRVRYTQLGGPHSKSFEDAITAAIHEEKPQAVHVVQPGDHRVLTALQQTADQQQTPLRILDDNHFLSTPQDFREHAKGRKQLRLEYFYREMRKRYGVLLDNGEPAGGAWNFDAENRKSFGKEGPGDIPDAPPFPPDAITREVITTVQRRFPDHPGELETFSWPVTRQQALEALSDFIEQRLPHFGDHQDAMWSDAPFLYHSRISSSLNLKLLHPREVVEAAEKAWRKNPRRYPLPAVEGFIRQVLGWREYVRGIYWLFMPEYLERNALGASLPLPAFYWTGDTQMNCLHQAIGQTLRYGYAHHIQRLMVTGLYALLLGVHPKAVHEWYLAVYVDAVEWVELPNTLGMSQFADGGVMASKPYAASGKYIQRMSNYCHGCRYRPDESVGENACPFTTLYWDFLLEHEGTLSRNQRMQMQLRNLQRLTPSKRAAIRKQAAQHREEVLSTSAIEKG